MDLIGLRAKKAGKVLGRQAGSTYADPAKIDAARAMLAGGTRILKTAKAVGLGTDTVHRLKGEAVT